MTSDQFVWLAWASAFLIPWAALYAFFPRHRRVMLRASLVTSVFGLTEPLFVPEYWMPPSVFDLAAKTGFDIESLIFTFAIGGVAVVVYNVATRRVACPMAWEERIRSIHRLHNAALVSPIVVFVPLFFLPWNPIYPGIIAMMLGAIATTACRRDLAAKSWIGGSIFLLYYGIFLAGLELTAPGYIARVWNLGDLSGIALLGVPIEELLFACAFGTYWSAAYEHLTWSQVVAHASLRPHGAEDIAASGAPFRLSHHVASSRPGEAINNGQALLI